MGRPSKNQQGPSAKERIEQAFWELLEEKPFHSITVKDLIKHAGVNRNTFYYHFESTEGLAVELVRSNIPVEFFGIMLNAFGDGNFDVSDASAVPDLDRRFQRIRLILKNGEPCLMELGRKEVISFFIREMRLDEKELSEFDYGKLDFIWGGIIRLLASAEASTPERYLNQLQSGIVQAVGPLVAQICEQGKA